ncbi:MAG: CvpA family protein [Luteimonas sp.]
MTGTDLLLLAVIGVSTLLGLMRGFIGVLASLAAWVLAGWAAFRFGAKVALALAGGAEPGAGQLLAGYGLSFLGVLIFVGVVGWLVRKLVHSVGLSGIDRALGVALGLARGGFVACMLVLLMGFTTMPREPGWRESQVVPVLLPGAQWLRGWLPDWAAARVDFGASAPHSIDIGNPLPLPQPGGA